jgi:acyl dehydratase
METSPPIALSDIRKWAIAVYWPETPPRLFWDEAYAATTNWNGIVAPEDFNPFAWPAARSGSEQVRSASGQNLDAFGVPMPHRRGPAPTDPRHRIGGMNAGRADEFGTRLRPGDTCTSKQRLFDWREEQTRLGPTLFVRTEILWTNQREEVVRRRLQTSLRYFTDATVPGSAKTPKSDSRPESDIPTWSRTTGLEHWNRFAAVNDEFVDMHMDDEAGRRAGNADGAFGMGNLRYAYILNALRDWLGDSVEVRKLECQFRALNAKGDQLRVYGVIKSDSVADGKRVIELDIDVLNQRDQSTCPGSATVAVPSGSVR